MLVVYNNIIRDKNLTPGWGWACLLEAQGQKILFDTGGNSQILLSNMQKLGIDSKGINTIVISHDHWDHTGGLLALLTELNEVTVYLPQSARPALRQKIKETGARLNLVKGPVKIAEHFHVTGEIGGAIKEQALTVHTPEGLVLVTGCAHPGILNIINKTRELFQERICLALGGFHLLDTEVREIKAIIKRLKELGVKRIGPSHCTGNNAIKLFKDAWQEDFVDSGCGAEIDFPTHFPGKHR